MAIKRKTDIETTPTPEVKEDAAIPASEVTSATPEAVVQLPSGNVQVELSCGVFEIREPRAKQLLLMEQFLSDESNPYRTDGFAALYMFHSCVVGEKPTFDNFIDELSVPDTKLVGEALEFFRSTFDSLRE